MTIDRAAIGGRLRARMQQAIFQTLMIALCVVVLDVRIQHGVAMPAQQRSFDPGIHP